MKPELMSISSSSEDEAKSVTPTYVGIALWITSEVLSVEEISKIVGLRPTYVQIKGERVARTNRIYEASAWKFGERLYLADESQMTHSAREFFDQFFIKIAKQSKKIRDLSAAHSVAITIIYAAPSMPFVGLTNSQLTAITELGARLDYDIAVYEC